MNVAAVQRALSRRGFDPGPPDGDAGPLTIAALAAFQRGVGLVADGIAGPRTMAALARPALMPEGTRTEPAWLRLARAELGTVEAPGQSNNPAVLAFFRDAGFPGIRDDAVAWCAAFVGAILSRAGFAPSGSLAARSYERWGVKLAEPRLGCVGVKTRPGSGWQGHVGFVVAAGPARVTLLGGNQGNAVSLASFPRAEFKAFRWPAGAAPPGPGAIPVTIAGAAADPSQA